MQAAAALSLAGVTAVSADDHKPTEAESAKEAPTPLIAVLAPTKGSSVQGTVIFEQSGEDQVRVTARVTGLKASQKHGFHVHQFGDSSEADGTSAGGHFNPEETPHALPGGEEESAGHVGDLGNLVANEDGVAEYSAVFDKVALTGEHGVLGRAVVVHHKADTGEQPTGAAGPRAAVGVIGYKNPEVNAGLTMVKVKESAKDLGAEILESVREGAENLEEKIEESAGD